jgi:polysaccharide pyruvyl transferase WcaK-like protein
MKARKPGLPPRVGVISPCGWGNLGDAAIVEATLDAIRTRIPSAAVFAITLNPKDTERRHRIPTVSLSALRYHDAESWMTGWERADSNGTAGHPPSFKRRLRNARWLNPLLRFASPAIRILANMRNEVRHVCGGFALIRDADLLIVAGGGQLDDYWGGAWAHPFNLLKWGCIAWLAGTPIVILSVGYGTSPSMLSRLFLRAVLRISAYRSFRDPRSASIAREGLGQSDAILVPDLAFGLPVDMPARAPVAGRTIVGISPIAFADPRSWPLKDAALYESYLGTLAQFVEWLSEQGHDLLFFCTDNKDVHCLRDLHSRCTALRTCLASDAERPAPYYKEVDELVAQLARSDVIIASRLHGVILAHLLAKPVLAISYDWKVDVHMKQVGESENTLDIRTLEASALIARFQHVAERRAETERKLRATTAGYARQIGLQFDLIVERFLSGPAVSRGD